MLSNIWETSFQTCLEKYHLVVTKREVNGTYCTVRFWQHSERAWQQTICYNPLCKSQAGWLIDFVHYSCPSGAGNQPLKFHKISRRDFATLQRGNSFFNSKWIFWPVLSTEELKKNNSVRNSTSDCEKCWDDSLFLSTCWNLQLVALDKWKSLKVSRGHKKEKSYTSSSFTICLHTLKVICRFM